MSKNMQRFASVMANRMRQTSNAAVPTTIELGIVNANMSITPDSLRAAIPKGDYMVSLLLTSGRFTADASYDGYTHKHELPEAIRGLRPGDRILIAWCGDDPVVIAVVVSS